MRPKSLSAEIHSAAAPPDFIDAPAGSRAPSGRGLPLLHSMLPSKSFYLSLPDVKEHPTPSETAGGGKKFRDGGRTWTRTRDLFLIREAL